MSLPVFWPHINSSPQLSNGQSAIRNQMLLECDERKFPSKFLEKLRKFECISLIFIFWVKFLQNGILRCYLHYYQRSSRTLLPENWKGHSRRQCAVMCTYLPVFCPEKGGTRTSSTRMVPIDGCMEGTACVSHFPPLCPCVSASCTLYLNVEKERGAPDCVLCDQAIFLPRSLHSDYYSFWCVFQAQTPDVIMTVKRIRPGNTCRLSRNLTRALTLLTVFVPIPICWEDCNDSADPLQSLVCSPPALGSSLSVPETTSSRVFSFQPRSSVFLMPLVPLPIPVSNATSVPQRSHNY